MTRSEYLKYNNPEAFDMQGKPVKPGDTVINSHYGSALYIGIVDHFTKCGKLAITYDYSWGSNTTKLHAYRMPRTVIKIKDGSNTTNQNKKKGNPKAV